MVVSEHCWAPPGEGEIQDQLNPLQERSLAKATSGPVEVFSLEKVYAIPVPRCVIENKNPNCKV